MKLDLEVQPKLSGREFENAVAKRLARHKQNREASVGRYGVQASVTHGGETIVLQSLPDFEGIVPPLPQVIFDTKVCSQSSFGLTEYRKQTKGSKSRQIEHLFNRANFGCVTFFFIHWNRRELKTKTDESMTTAIPVHERMPFWEEFLAGEQKSISRQMAVEMGYTAYWNLYSPACRIAEPNIFEACIAVDILLDLYR